MQKRVFLLAAFAAWLVHQPGCAVWSAQPAEPELERRLYVAEDGRVSVLALFQPYWLRSGRRCAPSE